MFTDMFNSLEKGAQPIESFYDGYIVNAIMDACYKSSKTKKWEPVELEIWRGKEDTGDSKSVKDYDEQYLMIKEEKLPNGTRKLILKDKKSGEIIQREIV
jgi:hypothetical protein